MMIATAEKWSNNLQIRWKHGATEFSCADLLSEQRASGILRLFLLIQVKKTSSPALCEDNQFTYFLC